MSSSKSALGRLFGALWAVVVGVYRVFVVLTLLVAVALVWLALRGGAPVRVDDNVALVIYPTGMLMDSIDQDPGQRFFEQLSGELPSQTLLRNLTDALDRAATDPRISLVVLKLDALWHAGLPQLEELAAAVARFRESGKPVYAYGPFYDQGHYRVAAEATHISLDPMGMVYLEGFGLYQNFFKDAIDKLGIEINVFRVGEYKSAVEPLERNDMSAEAREANEEWLGDLWGSYGRAVEQRRDLNPSAVHEYVLALPDGVAGTGGDAARFARERMLVDGVETLQQFRERVAETVGWDDGHGSFRQIHYSRYLRAQDDGADAADGKAPKSVALVVVQGDLVDGESQPGLAGSETVTDLLGSARLDDQVAALVLRVDSPGGSVFASERIRRELRALQADGKPVVVSMSNVAASGGYWIAMDADEIWAHETTVTGSIGIFAFWPTIDRPLAKLGIHTDGLGTTPLAGAFRADRPLSPQAAALIQSQLDHGYRLFIEGVAAGRELPVEKVQELARGRVWSGADALALGLVDQIGGLDDAVASAVRLAGLDEQNYDLQEFKQQYDFRFDSLLDLAGGARSSGLPLEQLLAWVPSTAMKPLGEAAQRLRWLSDPRGLYTHCFCAPAVSSRAH